MFGNGSSWTADRLRVLIVLTYYRPHTSGLTIYVERLARGLALRGHAVTVMTSCHERSLARDEMDHGVRIVRVPVVARISKGVVMPTFGLTASRLVVAHDVVSLHLPQLDAAGVAVRARLLGRPSVATYHCDLLLPAGLLNRAADVVIQKSHDLALRLSDRVVAYTSDYADHSSTLRTLKDRLVIIPPPVEMAQPEPDHSASFRDRLGCVGEPVIGMASRFATEKGVEVLLDAIRRLEPEYPGITVVFAGPYRDVIGERPYFDRLEPRVLELGDRWRFVGTLSRAELPAFYGSCDCLVLPSLNSTESFGLVQVESMLCGTPVVASDLPGVRQPVLCTGMGEIATPGDSSELASAIAKVLDDRDSYLRPRQQVEEMFSTEATVEAYGALFEELLAERRGHGS
jgi:glycosyltransferase involved in cell wall biosynthesis